ncbi:MAG: DUF2577 family protein [Oscillospiraceae bacterium]
MDDSPMSVKQLVQSMMQSDDGAVIEAQVVSAAPLKVQATNDAKLVLSPASLVVPRHLTNYTTSATFSLGKGAISSFTEGDGKHDHSGGGHGGHTAGSGEHSHTGDGEHDHHLVSFALTNGTITVHNALKVGEYVYLLPYNNGKKYYILDRRG